MTDSLTNSEIDCSSSQNDEEDDSSVSASSGSNFSSTGGFTGTSFETSSTTGSDKGEQLARAETLAVFRLRSLVILVLFLAAAAVSIFVYFLTKTSEHNEYLTQFEGSASIILRRFETILEDHLGAISTVSVAMAAHSIDHYRSWPFVSLSFIQQRFSKTNQIAGSMHLALLPLVSEENKESWEGFVSNPADRKWITEGLEYQEQIGMNVYDEATADDPLNENLVGSVKLTYNTDKSTILQEENGPGPYLPVWQTSPVLRQGLVNKNLYRNPEVARWANKTLTTQSAVLGGMDRAPPGYSNHLDVTTRFYATILSMNRKERTKYLGDPMTDIYIPVFDSFDHERKTVAVLQAVFHWKSYFENILPPNTPPILAVLSNSCEGDYTYKISGNIVEPIGPGEYQDMYFNYEGYDHKGYDDLHLETSWEGLEDIGDGTVVGIRLNQDECKYSMHVHATHEYYEAYNTKTPLMMTVAVVTVFIFTSAVFLLYDRLVEHRQNIVLSKAQQSDAIVSSLFPRAVRDRLMEEKEKNKKQSYMAPNHRIKNYLGGEELFTEPNNHAIADLFPNCTVLFGDIVGFTAWSSARDPGQVFDLLQNIYQSFDMLAKRRHVFKVETIGDCYVAVTGLPNPQPDHAVIMAKFASECRGKLIEVTRKLEVTLGPDTADLGMRFGLHSGPVTAGVLRGDRSRFQLFGDTVNTASRMESTGVCNKIHASQATAELIKTANRGNWVETRKDSVAVKGKGLLRTFWLHPTGKKAGSSNSSQVDEGERQNIFTSLTPMQVEDFLAKEARRIDWAAGLFGGHLKKVITRRLATEQKKQSQVSAIYEPSDGTIPLDEFADKVALTKFDLKTAVMEMEVEQVNLPIEVTNQIHDYVEAIAQKYQANPFHSFEHACHVTMSVVKLLKRIVTPDLDVEQFKSSDLASKLHDYTYGITSDPIATLAIIFSALIHDVDHRGISNSQLAKEEPDMAEMYRSKSIAEQNSLDIAWGILMQHKYSTLRKYMFATNDDLEHFRQVAVNVVLATDIFDKELNTLRTNRWNQAFSDNNEVDHEQPCRSDNDLKATIVIEHIIQASDVAHTMQHWHIYRRWNERLFMELREAYRSGRMAADPEKFWYQGEIAFFDNYIIPLARKLKDCGVFGVSSDEYLNYAMLNRDEWKSKGEAIVAELASGRRNSHISPIASPLCSP